MAKLRAKRVLVTATFCCCLILYTHVSGEQERWDTQFIKTKISKLLVTDELRVRGLDIMPSIDKIHDNAREIIKLQATVAELETTIRQLRQQGSAKDNIPRSNSGSAFGGFTKPEGYEHLQTGIHREHAVSIVGKPFHTEQYGGGLEKWYYNSGIKIYIDGSDKLLRFECCMSSKEIRHMRSLLPHR